MAVTQPTFRDRARTSVEPIARALGRLGLSPNALTFIGFFFALFGAVFAAAQMWLAATLLVAIGASFDMLDGALARATGQLSRLGAFLDSTIDRAGEVVVYIGIAWACMTVDFREGAVLAATAMASALLVSYTRARAESLGFASGKGLANIGLAPREVRVVILVVGLLLVGLSGGLTSIWPFADYTGNGWMLLTLGLITALATITTIQRIVFVYLQARKDR